MILIIPLRSPWNLRWVEIQILTSVPRPGLLSCPLLKIPALVAAPGAHPETPKPAVSPHLLQPSGPWNSQSTSIETSFASSQPPSPCARLNQSLTLRPRLPQAGIACDSTM